MRKLAGLLAVLVLLLQNGGAFAQTSDYEVIDSYKKKHQSLLVSIKAERDPGQHDALGSEIGRLAVDYSQHRQLLGEGLYPDTFDNSIGTLREQLQKTTERLALVEENRKDKATIDTISLKAEADGKTIVAISLQNEEYRLSLEKLAREVADLSAQIQRLTAENAGLLQQIAGLQREGRKDKESLARLKELTEKLNANIRNRDDLIVKMMGSLFDEYSKSDLTDEQRKDLFVQARDGDYVGKIIETIDGNLKSVERTIMVPRDVRLIKDEERKVSAKWQAIRPYVGKLYPDEQIGSRDLNRVDDRLSDWKKRIDETIWKSLQQVFVDQNIDIGTFGNADEFQARLLAYVDQQVKTPSRDKFRAFKTRVWDSPIKDQWLPVIPVDELTVQQRSDIEARIALWEKKNSMLFWRGMLIGVFAAIAAAVILVLVLKRKKRRSSPPR